MEISNYPGSARATESHEPPIAEVGRRFRFRANSPSNANSPSFTLDQFLDPPKRFIKEVIGPSLRLGTHSGMTFALARGIRPSPSLLIRVGNTERITTGISAGLRFRSPLRSVTTSRKHHEGSIQEPLMVSPTLGDRNSYRDLDNRMFRSRKTNSFTHCWKILFTSFIC